MPGPAQKAKKRDAQLRCLALIAQGHTIATAMRSVGRSPSTWERWRDEQWFAARSDQLRGRDATPLSPFVDFRRAYFGFDTYWHQQQIVDKIEQASGQQ
ncbi:MAG: hypothetical protein ACYCU7_18605, partial [Acidimicrobiales bacterium]